MQSYIKKSALIREFRHMVHGMSPSLAKQYDKPFFNILNRIYKKKPNNVTIDITQKNSLAFKINFSSGVEVNIEYFINSNPSTLFTIKTEGEFNFDGNDMIESELDEALNTYDLILSGNTTT